MKKLIFKKSVAAAARSAAMEAENHVKHGASSKIHKSRVNFLTIAVLALLTMLLGGCKKDGKAFRYDKVNIGDAKYIVQGGHQTKSATKNNTSGSYDFQKLTANGDLEPIVFFNEHGETITSGRLRIDYIFDVNSDFLYFYGTFPYIGEGEGVVSNDGNFYQELLANKKTEKIYAIPSRLHFGFGPYITHADGNIYSLIGGIAKFNPVDNTIENFYFGENEGGGNIQLIDRHGICLYNTSTGWRARHLSNWFSIVPMDEIPSNTPVILGNDGYIYFIIKVDNEGGVGLYRIDEAANNNVKTTLLSNHLINDYYVNIYNNHVNNSLMVLPSYPTSDSYLHEYNTVSNSWRSFPLPALNGERFVAQNCYYYFDSASRKISRLDLNSYEVSEISVSVYDVREVTTSLYSDDINFTGMRFSDSRQVAGTIDASGKVTIITESGDNNIPVGNLIPLN